MKDYGVVLVTLGILAVGGALLSSPSGAGTFGSDEPFVYDSHGHRNPFVPLVLPTPKPTPTPQSVVMIPPTDVDNGFNVFNVFQSSDPVPTPTPVLPPELIVNSILQTQGRPPLAVINHALLKEGDTIDGAEIKSIDASRVTIVYYGHEFTIYPGTVD